MAVSRLLVPGFVALLLGSGLVACGTEESSPDADAGDGGSDTSTPDGGGDTDVPDGGDTGVDTGTDVTDPLPEPDSHRPEAVTCDRERPFYEIPVEASGWGAPMDCTTHEECTDGENGRCTGNSHDGWRCTYDSCFEDADCGSTVCACDGGWRSGSNTCLGGNCQVDADCGAGGWCSPSMSECGLYGGVTGYWCHTPEDTCTDDSDCPGTGDFGGPGYCMFSQTLGHWECSYSQCAG